MHTIGEKKIRMLNPREIKKPPMAVRTVIDGYELSLLRDSIAASGVLQPLLVKRIKKGKYELISGQRRLQAALMAGLRRVPCVVHNADDQTALLYSLTENLQSRSLCIFDEAKAIDYLINKKNMSLSETAAHLGVTGAELYSKLQLLRLDERLWGKAIGAGLTQAHIKALLRLPKEGRAQALDTVISGELSAKQTEDYVFSVINPPASVSEAVPEVVAEEKEKPIRKTAIGDIRLLSNSLVKMVDTLKESGIKVSFKKVDSEKYIEYKIKIKKEAAPNDGSSKDNLLKSGEFAVQFSCL